MKTTSLGKASSKEIIDPKINQLKSFEAEHNQVNYNT